MRLTQDEFLNTYSKLLAESIRKSNGSVEVTFKRYDVTHEATLPKAGAKGKDEAKGTGAKAANPEAGAAAGGAAASTKSTGKGDRKSVV